MKEHEEQAFEQQLRGELRPRQLPEDFKSRLSEAAGRVRHEPETARFVRKPSPPWGLLVLRWLTPATALVLLSALLWHNQHQQGASEPLVQMPATTPQPEETPIIAADKVQIGEELVSSFDTVARLPSGEPMRFRVERWMDQVAVDDSAQGLSFERRMPRVVVTPVRFETY